jgi:hypothetical protein
VQIKSTLRFHLSHLEWLSLKTQTKTNVGEDVGKQEHLHAIGGNIN